MIPAWTDSPVFIRFVRYLIVSFFSFVLDLIIVYVFVQFFQTNYLVAIAIGYVCEVAALFFSNRAWTFASHTKTWRIVFSAAINLMTLAFILIITYIEVQNFAIPYLMARTIAGTLAIAWSYYWDARLTFQIDPLS